MLLLLKSSAPAPIPKQAKVDTAIVDYDRVSSFDYLASETFDTANNSPWGTQWAAVVGVGAVANVQGGKGLTTTGAIAYGGSRKDLTTLTSTGSMSFTGTVTGFVDNVEQYAVVSIDSDHTGGGWFSNNAYALMMQYMPTSTSSTISLRTAAAGSESTLVTLTKNLVGTSTYAWRIERVGLTLQARVWDAAQVEPSSWDLSYTLTGTPYSGKVSVATGSGNVATARSFGWDKLLLTSKTETATPNPNKGYLAVRTSTAYIIKPSKVWNGTAWVNGQVRVWNGTIWKYTYDSTTTTYTFTENTGTGDPGTYSGNAMVEDTNDPGTYILQGTKVTQSGTEPGIYNIN